MITVTIPGMRLRSPNAMRGTTRGARMALAKYTHNTREAAAMLTLAALRKAVRGTGLDYFLPKTDAAIITLTRIAPRAFDDDNLAASFKALRDGVADGLTVDDGDPRVTWRYAQRRGKAREYAVIIEIVPRADDYPAGVPEMVERAL